MSWHHGDWLSFAQAVGSFLAIIGAFGVVFIQDRLQKKARADETAALSRQRFKDKASYCHNILVLFRNPAERIAEGIRAVALSGRSFKAMKVPDHDLTAALHSIDVALHNDLPPELLKPMFLAALAFTELRRAVNNANGDPISSPVAVSDFIDERLAIISESIKEIRAMVDR